MGALAHAVTSLWLYLHLLNKALWCLTDTTRLARWDINSAGCQTSTVAGVVCSVQVAALGLWATACLGVAGVTVGCTMGAVGASCMASGIDGVVTGCPATSTLRCMSASGWWSRMWSHAHLYSAPPMTLMMYKWCKIGCTYYSGREPQCPVIIDYRSRLVCIKWGFPMATCMVMVSCTVGWTFL